MKTILTTLVLLAGLPVVSSHIAYAETDAEKIRKLEEQIISQQQEILSVQKFITKGTKARGLCFYGFDECIRYRDEIQLLNGNNVVINTTCKYQDHHSDLDSTCQRLERRWVLETTVRLVLPDQRQAIDP